jgi:hypothetical protein
MTVRWFEDVDPLFRLGESVASENDKCTRLFNLHYIASLIVRIGIAGVFRPGMDYDDMTSRTYNPAPAAKDPWR